MDHPGAGRGAPHDNPSYHVPDAITAQARALLRLPPLVTGALLIQLAERAQPLPHPTPDASHYALLSHDGRCYRALLRLAPGALLACRLEDPHPELPDVRADLRPPPLPPARHHPHPPAQAYLQRASTFPHTFTDHAIERAQQRLRRKSPEGAKAALLHGLAAARLNPYPRPTPPAANVFEADWHRPGQPPLTVCYLTTEDGVVVTVTVRPRLDYRPLPQQYAWDAQRQAFAYQPPASAAPAPP